MSERQIVRSDYWRNRDGSIVHTNECIYAGSEGSQPWILMQGKVRYYVRAEVATVPWLRLCGKCWPKDNE